MIAISFILRDELTCKILLIYILFFFILNILSNIRFSYLFHERV